MTAGLRNNHRFVFIYLITKPKEGYKWFEELKQFSRIPSTKYRKQKDFEILDSWLIKIWLLPHFTKIALYVTRFTNKLATHIWIFSHGSWTVSHLTVWRNSTHRYAHSTANAIKHRINVKSFSCSPSHSPWDCFVLFRFFVVVVVFENGPVLFIISFLRKSRCQNNQ